MKTPCKVLGSVAAIIAAALPYATDAAPSPPQYKVVQSVALGAPDRWDYVIFDASSGRVFVAHGDELTVVDGEKGGIVGHVTGLPGITHGIALVQDSNRGYTDEGKAGNAVSFNLKTLAVQKHIPAAEGSDAMTFDPVSNHVFVVNGDAGNITVIDPKTDSAVATIDVGGDLEYAVPGENGKLFVNGAEKRELISIDTATNSVTARWPLPDCESPHGLAIDPSAHRLFVSCENQVLTVVDSQSGHIVATTPIGKGSDAVVFDAKRQLIFSSNGGDGTLSVIKAKGPKTYEFLGNIKTSVTARTVSINPTTGRLYLATADIVPSAAPKNGRPPITPGSLKLLFLDPAQ